MKEKFKGSFGKNIVEVIVPRLLTDYEKEIGKEDGYSNFFVRDPFFTIGHFLIEGSLRFPHRYPFMKQYFILTALSAWLEKG
ncbi:hypothetical protein [Kroppenstedtia pulmonis]|uniref:hypothetical protein n=1 Tax=Kroppenstedtia pulmonis TaxID=1380685 RepID=UPI001FED2025|nr:hypothetical protein [Kroppenstedtia pulmonis]